MPDTSQCFVGMLSQQELCAYKHLCKFTDKMHCLFSSLQQYMHSFCDLQNDFSLSGIQRMDNTEQENCCSALNGARDLHIEDLRKLALENMEVNVRNCILNRYLVDVKAINDTKKSLDWGNVYILDFCSNENLPIALKHRQLCKQQVEAIDAAHPSTCNCPPEGAMESRSTGAPPEPIWEPCELDAGDIAAQYFVEYLEENQKQTREQGFESRRKRAKCASGNKPSFPLP